MSNATMAKFGFPATVVKEFEHWVVLLRPAQVTLGSVVLAAKSEATAYAALPDQAFAEQALVVRAIETALADFVGYEKLNYLMLMMVDPHVHFHVLPRYSGERRWNGVDFRDAGWPGPPELKSAVQLDDRRIAALIDELQSRFV